MSESSAEEDGMAFGHLLDTYPRSLAVTRRPLGRSRPASAGLAHLVGMDTDATTPRVLEPALTLSELAARLSVSAQTLYDLRSKGRGPRGFRVGRELRFRQSEVDAWLSRLEAADQARHPVRGSR